MAQILVPQTGLTLVEPSLPKPDNETSKSGNMPTQAMLLDLDESVFQDVLRSARDGGKGLSVNFGKTITLNYGTKSQNLVTSPSPLYAQLYTYSTDNGNELAFAGRLSHKLTMQKAQEDIAGADEALEKLQSQLAGFKKEKASNQITFVQDNAALPPPHKQTAASLKQKSSGSSMAFLKKNNTPSRFGNEATRSMPVSPAIGASRTPLTQKPAPTSIPTLPNGRAQRLQAIRTPLIHMLAARPASTKLLSNNLNCKAEDILEVLQKVGKKYRLDESKWDLTDKAFKELDVFDFHYPNDGDRELAIGRAISAFDRMRISTSEKIWDKLMPKTERGKGKILSHLNLRKGPINSGNTPRIQVQHPDMKDDDRNLGLDGNDSDRKDRLAPSDAEPGRSRSQGAIKKKKVSEKEAQSKRLLSKGPKKETPASTEKEAHPAVKKGAKKANAPKSSEFVNDSDEEDGLEDAAILHARSQTPKKENATKASKVLEATKTAAPSPKAKASKPAVSTPKVKASKPAAESQSGRSTPASKKAHVKEALAARRELAQTPKPAVANSAIGKGVDATEPKAAKKATLPAKVPEKKAAIPANVPEKKPTSPSTPTASSPVSRPQASDVSQGGTAMKKTLSRQRNTSSPHKPSPLGSSPPTNASDLENATNSSKSSTPVVRKNATPNGATSVNGQSRNVSEHSSTSSVPSSGKNNATPDSIALVNGARNTSEHTLKRKAGDLDSGNHNHGTQLTNGNVNGYANGVTNPSKRQKTSEMTPPTSDSGDSPLARDAAIRKAADFKRYYDTYTKLYIEVSQLASPPQEKLDAVKKMHNRLAEMKDQIKKGLGT
ncbi:hypothetical protein P7C71_g555, partial [Lecanoromycetidae sp. Uapishka_2]